MSVTGEWDAGGTGFDGGSTFDDPLVSPSSAPVAVSAVARVLAVSAQARVLAVVALPAGGG